MSARRAASQLAVSVAALALVVVSAHPLAHRQDEPRMDPLQAGLLALEANRPDEAIAHFQERLRRRPHDDISAYNIACAYSRKNDAQMAVSWLARAADWGYEDVEWMLEDADLAHARTHDGFWEVIDHIQSRLPSARRREIVRTRDADRALDLVVMLRSELGAGAGVVIGHDGARVYLATANHVVRRGRTEASSIEVQLKPLGSRWHQAALMPALPDPELDVAVLAVDGAMGEMDFCTLPMRLGGDSTRLQRGDRVYPVGYPNGIEWAIPVSPDRVGQASAAQIAFESQFIRVGSSGGALLNGDGEVVGMITADEPPLGRAIPLARLLAAVRAARYPVQLSTPDERAGRPLSAAARRGDVPALERLLEGCADPDESDDTGRPALHVAAAQGSLEAVERLLDAGANVHAWGVVRENDTEREWGTPLHVAAEHGSAGVVRALLAAGTDLDLQTLLRFDPDANLQRLHTALHVAALHDRNDVAELLVDSGAALDGIDPGGLTPLMVAAAHDAVRVARTLLARGALLDDLGNGYEQSPLHHASAAGAVDVMQLLIERGADVNARFGTSPAVTPLFRAAEHRQVAAADILIAAGADVNATGYGGNSPVHVAVERGASDLVRRLLAGGADPDRSNDSGLTPLMIAADRGDPANLITLLDAGARIGTALHLALERGHIEAARLLTRGGADLSLRNSSGMQPLHIAARLGLTEAADALIGAGALVSAIDAPDSGRVPLHFAAENGHADVVRRLIAANAPIDPQERSGRTPLYLAVSERHGAVVSLLLEAGADPNIEARYTQTQNTPLAQAAGSGPLEILILLLDAGADPNSSGDSAWMSPLTLAASSGSLERVALLLERKADASGMPGSVSPVHAALNQAESAAAVIERLTDAGSPVEAVDGEGFMPLHTASVGLQAEAVRTLLAKGASVDAVARQCGITPLWHTVAQSRHDETRAVVIVETLVGAGANVNATNTCTNASVLDMAERNGYSRVRDILLANRDADRARRP